MSSLLLHCLTARRMVRILLAASPALLFVALPVYSRAESPQSPLSQEGSESAGLRITPPDRAVEFSIFPPESLFPSALSDPHSTGFGFQIMNLSRTAIADSGGQRFNLRAGGRFGVVRIHPSNEPGLGWQFGIEGGFDAQFDMEHSLDNIGWDGNYGFLLEHAPSSSLAFKISALHTSSHVGDEYAERTGRLRIGYTRHEAALGASWRPNENWRVYGEAGRGYNLRNDNLQKPGRLQTGIEHISPDVLWGGKMGWYAALDLQSWEERDWRIDTAAQAGVLFRTPTRLWRFGIEYVDGRPTLGEFFLDTERWVSIGLWIDI